MSHIAAPIVLVNFLVNSKFERAHGVGRFLQLGKGGLKLTQTHKRLIFDNFVATAVKENATAIYIVIGDNDIADYEKIDPNPYLCGWDLFQQTIVLGHELLRQYPSLLQIFFSHIFPRVERFQDPSRASSYFQPDSFYNRAGLEYNSRAQSYRHENLTSPVTLICALQM